MIKRWSLVVLVVALVGGVAWADSWMEKYSGLGASSDRESACTSAQGNAQMSALTACMGRRGSKVDDSFDCTCQKLELGDSVTYTCTGWLKVYCEKPTEQDSAREKTRRR